jgi:hypothetical protein
LAEKDDKKTENSLRQKIWALASSGFGLLILGGILTGFLVPTFQAYQRKLEWERQIRYENVKFNLGMRRDCLKEMMIAGTFVSTIIESVAPFKDDQPISRDQYEKLRQQLLTLQNERFKQNAKVVSMLGYFSDHKRASNLFNDYTGSTTSYIGGRIERFLYLKYSISQPSVEKAGDKKELADLTAKIDDTSELVQKFDLILDYMLVDIQKKEDEYVEAKF